ncbi:hypothetical protein ACTA71_006606 [Dictyostelium dimigraforme]
MINEELLMINGITNIFNYFLLVGMHSGFIIVEGEYQSLNFNHQIQYHRDLYHVISMLTCRVRRLILNLLPLIINIHHQWLASRSSNLPFIIHHRSSVIHHSPSTIHPSSFIIHHSSFILHHIDK